MIEPVELLTPSDQLTAEAAADALAQVPGPLLVMFRHGSLSVEYYGPEGVDHQTAHTRDEIYVIASGTGTFVNGDERHPFQPGQVLFVPAGVVHRFEDFSGDFATWVFFYGPEGGEAADTP